MCHVQIIFYFYGECPLRLNVLVLFGLVEITDMDFGTYADIGLWDIRGHGTLADIGGYGQTLNLGMLTEIKL